MSIESLEKVIKMALIYPERFIFLLFILTAFRISYGLFESMFSYFPDTLMNTIALAILLVIYVIWSYFVNDYFISYNLLFLLERNIFFRSLREPYFFLKNIGLKTGFSILFWIIYSWIIMLLTGAYINKLSIQFNNLDLVLLLNEHFPLIIIFLLPLVIHNMFLFHLKRAALVVSLSNGKLNKILWFLLPLTVSIVPPILYVKEGFGILPISPKKKLSYKEIEKALRLLNGKYNLEKCDEKVEIIPGLHVRYKIYTGKTLICIICKYEEKEVLIGHKLKIHTIAKVLRNKELIV